MQSTPYDAWVVNSFKFAARERVLFSASQSTDIARKRGGHTDHVTARPLFNDNRNMFHSSIRSYPHDKCCGPIRARTQSCLYFVNIINL